jgi:hypothetical protein
MSTPEATMRGSWTTATITAAARPMRSTAVAEVYYDQRRSKPATI